MAKRTKPPGELVAWCRTIGGEPLGYTEALAVADGLAVCRSAPAYRRKRGPFMVIHIQSGLGVAWYSSQTAAIMGLARLTMFLDWPAPGDSSWSEAHATAAAAEVARGAYRNGL
jgi:hypothetical protein